jgi:hypothetical protein
MTDEEKWHAVAAKDPNPHIEESDCISEIGRPFLQEFFRQFPWCGVRAANLDDKESNYNCKRPVAECF